MRAEYESVHGRIAAGYEAADGKIVYTAEIPEGAEAEIELLGEAPVCAGAGSIPSSARCLRQGMRRSHKKNTYGEN